MGVNAVITEESNNSAVEIKNLGGKYLTFILGKEVFGVQITKVQEIIRMQNVTKVPRVKNFVRGVINLRGKIIPVIELRLKFGMEPQKDTEKTCIIVIQVKSSNADFTIGIIIDEVREVLDISSENIEPPCMVDYSEDQDFILGIGKVADEVKILLDIDQILTISELSMVSNIKS